jgi:hypothetical protein
MKVHFEKIRDRQEGMTAEMKARQDWMKAMRKCEGQQQFNQPKFAICIIALKFLEIKVVNCEVTPLCSFIHSFIHSFYLHSGDPNTGVKGATHLPFICAVYHVWRHVWAINCVNWCELRSLGRFWRR